MGNNIVGHNKKEIYALVDGGDSQKWAKQSAAQIQEILCMRHPARFDIPSTYHINSCMHFVHIEGEAALKHEPGRTFESLKEQTASTYIS